MNLTELYTQLALGELSQHKIGKGGSIAVEDYPAVNNYINRALTALYSRLPLEYKEVLIVQQEGVTDYRFDSSFSVHSGNDLTYIMDTIESPFNNDLLRVDGVFDVSGYELPINDEINTLSVFTPDNKSLQIPFPEQDRVISVVYRANPIQIPLNTTNPEDIEIEIPQSLETALLAYIASKAYISLGNASSAQLSSYYMNVYDSEIRMIERYNILNGSNSDSSTKFFNNGWV